VNHTPEPKQNDLRSKARATGVGVLVILLILLPVFAVGYAYRVFLLAFGGLLSAVLLRRPAVPLSRHAHLPVSWCLVIILVLILLIGGGAVEFAAPRVSGQIDQLAEKIPESLSSLRGWLQGYAWGRRLVALLSRDVRALIDPATILTKTTNYLYSAVWVITGLVLLLFIGLYLSFDPDLYRRGIVRCIPARKRTRAGEVIQGVEHVLQRWLIGKCVSMTLVGILTGIGLWLLGIPLAFTLAIIAALLAFIPNFGPVISAFPAVLLGLLQSPMMSLYVILLYLGVQLVESYMITPLVQRKAVSLPPVLLIVFQVLMGVLAGSLGLIFATPLLAALLVIVEMLYVQDFLGESVTVAGHSDPGNR